MHTMKHADIQRLSIADLTRMRGFAEGILGWHVSHCAMCILNNVFHPRKYPEEGTC